MCNYNFDLPVDPIPLMVMVQQLIEQNGGRVTGKIPNVAVSFSTPMGQVAGSCRIVSGFTINLTISKKPEIYTCAMVRDRLVAYITEAVKMYSLRTAAAD